MVFLWASSRLLVWLYIFSFTVVVLWLHQFVERGQVSCVRTVSNVGSLSAVPGAAFCRGAREPVGGLLGYWRLVNNSSWSRNVRASDKSAAALGNGDETLRTVGSSDNEDEKLLSEWRFSRLLLCANGSRRFFKGKKTSRDTCLAKLNDCPSGRCRLLERRKTVRDIWLAKDNECPSELVRRSIAQVKYVQAGAWPHFSAALAAGIPFARWHRASKRWQKRAKPFGLGVFYKEAGGGGDCMYYAIAASLVEVADNFPHLQGMTAQTVRNAAAVAFIGSQKLIDGEGATEREKQQFLEKLGILVALEESGSWEDRWSPVAIMRQNMYVNSAGVKMETNTVGEKARALFSELSRSGPSHLGTHSDLAPLQEALDVGFIVLHEGGYIYAMAADTSVTRPVYSLLYFRGGGHFQVAGIGSVETGIRSAFLAAELPDFLHCAHIVDCHSPVYPTGALGVQGTSR